MRDNFKKGLQVLLDALDKQNESSTPDWILAEFLNDCLNAFNKAINERESWINSGKKKRTP